MTRFRLIVLHIAAALSLASAAPAAAQAAGNPARPQLERRVRERIARVVQDRLGLTDAQMEKLEVTNERFAERRRSLWSGERTVRRDLRAQLEAGDRADQKRVSELVDRLLTFQAERLELARAEQRELAGYLTPVQRAKYLVLQDEIRRRVEDMHEGRRGGPPRGGQGRPRPR